MNDGMNLLESWLVYGRLRSWTYRLFELPILRSLGLNEVDKRVLVVGCGSGGMGLQAKVTGIDLNEGALRQARKREPDAQHCVMDATKLAFADGSFDAVIGIAVLHHVAKWRQALREASRVLSPGGMLAIADFTRQGLNRAWLRWAEQPAAAFSQSELMIAMLLSDFSHIRSESKMFGDLVFCVGMK